MKKIKLLFMDVDGTLTDGKIYMGQDGEILKAFDIKDGCGILLLLPKYHIIPVIITARTSKILSMRCKELNISELHQGVKNKLDKMNEIVSAYSCNLESTAYIGDDIPDIPCMEAIKSAGGLVLCPSDAIPEIKAMSDYTSGYAAGSGAVRDCINFLIQNSKTDVKDKIENAILFIKEGLYQKYPEGNLPNGDYFTIQEYTTKPEMECVIESHRKHIDIQYVLEGHEKFITYISQGLTRTGEYNIKNDIEYWQNGIISSETILIPSSMIIVYNGIPHKGTIIWNNIEKVKKIVYKIKI